MHNFMHKLKLEQNKGGEGDGGGKAPPAPKEEDKGSAPAVETDELGYEKVVEDKAPADPAGDKESDPKPDEKKIETPATGYGEEPPKVEEPPAPKEDEPVVDDGIKTEGLPKEEADKIREFAKQHKATKEITQAMVELRKSELKKAEDDVKAFREEQEKERQKVRAEWHRELKSDATFGGEKFAHNIHQAEKVMEEFMPNTKKVLTERKAMLPPYVMRDLAKLADHLYSTEKLAQGDPSVPQRPEDKNEDDPLAFYQ